MTASTKPIGVAALVVLLSSAMLRADGNAAAQNAAAQNTPTIGGNAVTLPTLPGANIPNGQNLTPEQLKSIMAYRYLQSRGSGQVKRGVPQFVPFGFGNAPLGAQAQQALGADPAAAPTSDRDAKKEAAKQKRTDALKAAAEKKKAAREARAAQRKAQQGQAPVAAGGN